MITNSDNKKMEKEPGMDESFVIAQRIATSLTGELTDEERQQLEEWRTKSEKNRMLYDRIIRKENQKQKRAEYDFFDKETGWKDYQKRQLRRRKILPFQRYLLRYAAFLLIPLGVALYLWLDRGSVASLPSEGEVAVISPGGARASLILESGEVIDLSAISGEIKTRERLIALNREFQLSYQETVFPDNGAHGLEYNEMVVPRGGEYQLLLEDGTLVYLNSMSKIRFPVRFEGDTREVELEGEAYFKVAENKEKPFVVRTSCYDVRVLGTQFNITSYTDEALTSTTLVQGAVAITMPGGVDRKLEKNERFVLDKNTGKMEVEKVDVSYFTAWKDGKFRFRDVRLEEIMRVVERWYQVTVEYEDEEVKDFRFGFNVSRHETIEPLLRIFELNGKVKINREDNVLKVRRGR